jgi:LacI family transcriptional regulator
MRVTIKDVAKQARVSPATVSLVLNNAPGVSTVTREKVMRVMSEVNYKPDALARSFSSRRAEAIALVMPPTLESLNDPYFMNLLRGTLEAVRDHGYKMLLEIADERFIEQRLWEDLFLRNRIDGLVVATPQLDQEYLKALAGSEYRALLVNGARPDIPELDFVGYDDVRCGNEATYYLIGLGHRRIAHLAGPQNQASAVSRLEGYQQALERARIPLRPEDVIVGDYRSERAEEAMASLLERPVSERPTALFCANDTIALAAMGVAQAAGLSVPGDFSVIGVDDTGAAERSTPPLTTLRQDIYGLSHRASNLFLKKLEERTREVIREYIPMTLIERGTCAPLDRGR